MVLWPRDESLFLSACNVIAKLDPKVHRHDTAPAKPTWPCTHSGICETRRVAEFPIAHCRLLAPPIGRFHLHFHRWPHHAGTSQQIALRQLYDAHHHSLSPRIFICNLHPHIAYPAHSTPTSRMTRNIRRPAKLIRPFKNSYFKSSPDPRSNTFLRFDWATLEFADLVAAKLIETQPLSLEKKIAGWLLQSLHHDQDFERFLDCLPGFYRSRLVKEPKEIFRNHHRDQVPCAVLSFLYRTLSSVTLPGDIKQRRIKLSFQVMELDSYLLERTFSHILSLPEPTVFRCIDFVLVADRFSREANANLDVQLLATCTIAVAISNITSEELMDERWLRSSSAGRPYRHSIPTLRDNLNLTA